MPKKVDHNRRREEIATFTLELIRREGLENATLRTIAEEGGFSMGVLTHYFRSKDEIVGFAFHFLAQRSFDELDALLETQPPGLARLETALEYMFPKPDRPANFSLWMSLWDRAIRNQRLAREHRSYYKRWRGYIKRSLTEACRCGQVRTDLAIANATDLLVAAIEGLWIYSVMDPRRFSTSRLRDLLGELISSLAPRASRSATASRRAGDAQRLAERVSVHDRAALPLGRAGRVDLSALRRVRDRG